MPACTPARLRRGAGRNPSGSIPWARWQLRRVERHDHEQGAHVSERGAPLASKEAPVAAQVQQAVGGGDRQALGWARAQICSCSAWQCGTRSTGRPDCWTGWTSRERGPVLNPPTPPSARRHPAEGAQAPSPRRSPARSRDSGGRRSARPESSERFAYASALRPGLGASNPASAPTAADPTARKISGMSNCLPTFSLKMK